MERYLVDTNIISDYFSASLPDSGLRFMDFVIDERPKISIITQIELLCWKTDADKEQRIKDFIFDCEIFDISSDVIEKCVNIRRNFKIKTPDAIIAATALALGYGLITNNERDFVGIKMLKIINPHKF